MKRPLMVAAVVVPLDLGPVGVFPWCMPSYSSESDLGLSVLLAREKELNVGHFLRLPVTQYGRSSQDGAGMSGGKVWGREPSIQGERWYGDESTGKETEREHLCPFLSPPPPSYLPPMVWGH